jgi:hypothetical protein
VVIFVRLGISMLALIGIDRFRPSHHQSPLTRGTDEDPFPRFPVVLLVADLDKSREPGVIERMR